MVTKTEKTHVREKEGQGQGQAGQEVSDVAQCEYAPKDMPLLAGASLQTILDKIADGALLRDIGAEYGVGRTAVSMYISRHARKADYATVREQSMEARLDKAEEMLTDENADQVTLARAREAARLWMWRAEREFPHRWASRPTTAVQVNAGDGGVQLVVYGAPGDTQSAIAVENPSQP